MPALAARRLALSVRHPRSLLLPVTNPVLFALVIAPALANTAVSPSERTAYMTFLALAGRDVVWFIAATVIFTVLMYSAAEILATRLPSAEAYTAAIPVVAIVPFFFAGSLSPITPCRIGSKPSPRCCPSPTHLHCSATG